MVEEMASNGEPRRSFLKTLHHMNTTYNPKDYNSLSPYLIVDGAKKLVDLLKTIFNATELRRFDNDNGAIQHVELKLEDSVILISDSTDKYPASTTVLHMYVPDVLKTYQLPIDNGCESIEELWLRI
jgi:PhnB protein